MIDKPENGQVPEMPAKEADPAQSVETATAVAEPDKHTSHADEVRSEQPSPLRPAWARQTQTPMTEPAQAAPAAPVSEAEFSSELIKFRKRFEEILAEFIGEPHAAVEKAETLIDGLMAALRNQLQNIHSKVESETDTEQLRVAMLRYRDLFDSLGGHRAA